MGVPLALIDLKGSTLNELISAVVRTLVLIGAVIIGAVFFSFFLLLAAGVGVFWGARRLWARVTGKPVEPWVFRFDPRSGFRTAYQGVWSRAAGMRSGRSSSYGGATEAEHAGSNTARRRAIDHADVTDVTPKYESGS